VSSVVAETSTQHTSQVAKPKSGASSLSSAGNGFSGLVDGNLAAQTETEGGSTPAKPRNFDRSAAADQQATRTGLQRKTKNAEPARTSAPAEKPAQLDNAKAVETTADITIAVEAALKTGLVTAGEVAELVEATPKVEAEQASPPVASPVPAATGIVAAVVIPTELALEASTEQVIESGEAITVTNPPATIVKPAETAANALAKVAAETGDAEVNGNADTEAAVQTPAATVEAAPEAAATETAAEAEALIETAAAEVQLDAKAKTELSTAAKPVDPPKPVAPPEHAKLEAAVKIEPAGVKEEPAAERPSSMKPVAHDDHRVEAKPASQASSEKPAETEARPAQKSAQEQPAQVSTPPQPEKPQPNGFGLTQVAALHVPGVALQSAAFTAVAAPSGPVPLNGLAVEIAANVQIGRSRFEIRLDPPELGRIDVRLDVDKQGQVTSHLIVEKPATLDLLRRDAQQLERALQDAGLKTSDNGLQFSLRDQQQSGRQDDEGAQRNTQRLIVTEEETIAAETAGRSYGRMIGRRGGIDIRV
jgi:chemotaxis protein MotD